MEYLLITRNGDKVTEKKANRDAVERVAIIFSVAHNLDISDFMKKFRNNEQCAFAYRDGDFEIAVVVK
ncbi:MAG: hypothetical protein II411_00700 [Lachnospiraceae bacterium]|nr:hypothetical protein [Lachnospiraceae bacterium]